MMGVDEARDWCTRKPCGPEPHAHGVPSARVLGSRSAAHDELFLSGSVRHSNPDLRLVNGRLKCPFTA